MKHLILFSLIAVFKISHAQLPDYYVYLVKGTVSVSRSNGKPQSIKQGDFIFNNDALAIGKNSEVTLVNRNTEYIVLNTPGTVKASMLSKMSSKTYTGVTKKYLHLVWEEVLDPNYDFTKFKQKNLTGVYGGVSRGESCENLLFPVNGLKTSENTLHFKWLQTSAARNYNFYIYDGSGKEILSKQVKDTQMIIGIDDTQLQSGKYYWLIKSDDGNCEDEVPLYFEILSKEQENNLLASILPATQNDSLVTELDTIDRLEKNALIYTAKAHYNNLIKNNSGNKALRRIYIMFLLNYGFDEEAASAWK